MLLLNPKSFKGSLCTLSQKFRMSFKSILTTFSPTIRGRHTICLALDCCPKWMIFRNLSSLIHKICHSHLSLSLITALVIRIELDFLYSFLIEIRSVRRVPKRICISLKHTSKSSSVFGTAHISEPYLTTVITVASNILFLVCRHFFLLFFQIL